MLSQDADLTQDYAKADELRYGGVFDGYPNSVVKLRFRNGKLARIDIEIIHDDLNVVYDEIQNKVTFRYQVSPSVDEDSMQALWTFDDSRYIKLYRDGILLVLEYADDALLNADEGESPY